MLGDPVAHSLSPALHTAALAAAEIAGTYEARRVDAEQMRSAIDEVRSGALDGVNVTMPHKRLTASLVDELAGTARRTGSVNTVVRVAGRTVGHNTDVAGVQHAARAGALPADAPVLVLGAGGAAAAAVLAFAGRRLVVAARDQAAAAELVASVRVEAETAAFGDAVRGAVVVNATPLGMHGEELPGSCLAAAGGLLDMAYGPDDTPAVEWARANGMPVADGPEMLLGQAIAAFRLWTGRSPLEAMRAVLTGRRGAGAIT